MSMTPALTRERGREKQLVDRSHEARDENDAAAKQAARGRGERQAEAAAELRRGRGGPP